MNILRSLSARDVAIWGVLLLLAPAMSATSLRAQETTEALPSAPKLEAPAPQAGPEAVETAASAEADAKMSPELAKEVGIATIATERFSTADHSKFPELQKEFKTGPEVTAACLGCHTEAAHQIMQTSHWTWICPIAREELAERHGVTDMGKQAHIINNFCVALGSNEPRCTSCHAGYGWKDKTFWTEAGPQAATLRGRDPNEQVIPGQDPTRVDCLVCHDTTGKYKKFPTKAGELAYHSGAEDFVPPEWPPKKTPPKYWKFVVNDPDKPETSLAHIARKVGKPSRDNCGTCHFYGGGGEGVKHGDMDATLSAKACTVDVHMSTEGANFSCTECHTTHAHKIAGRCFTIPGFEQREHYVPGQVSDANFLACESCHDAAPHHDQKLNDHTDKVACQTCHIPKLARGNPTKMWWDWSKAGDKKDGKPYQTMSDVNGIERPSYDSKKGEFVWAQDAMPQYAWFNGQVDYSFIGDKIDDETPGSKLGIVKNEYDKLDLSKPVVIINKLLGSYDDPNSRIYPVKYHRGIQPYDTVNKTLAVPKLFGPKGSNSYWSTWDWNTAITTGMEYVGQPYSGEFDWIQTEMAWPQSHMVAPEHESLQCDECHAPEGRLANLEGFYMPGRDRNALLDWIGFLLIGVSVVGVIGHGCLRACFCRKGGAK